MSAHSGKTPTHLNSIVPEVPVELAEVVARMLAKNPSDRYETPKEVALSLKQFVSHYTKPNIALNPNESARPPETQQFSSPARETPVEVKKSELAINEKRDTTKQDLVTNSSSSDSSQTNHAFDATGRETSASRQRNAWLYFVGATVIVVGVGAAIVWNPFKHNLNEVVSQKSGPDESVSEKKFLGFG